MIFGDYHIHSKFSKDAVSTMEENVKMAVQKGLKQIALTEHGFYHMHGISRSQYKKIKKEIQRLRIIYPISILFGIEANLIDRKGNIDLKKEEQAELDLVILGYHKSFKFGNILKILSHTAMGKNDEKSIEKNTKAYIRAMEKHKINVLAHLNYGCRVNVVEIAEYCKDHNIFIELNGKRIDFNEKEIQGMINTGVKFILNSDAHEYKKIGDVHLGRNIIEKYNIPYGQVVNLNKFPEFKVIKEKQ